MVALGSYFAVILLIIEGILSHVYKYKFSFFVNKIKKLHFVSIFFFCFHNKLILFIHNNSKKARRITQSRMNSTENCSHKKILALLSN